MSESDFSEQLIQGTEAFSEMFANIEHDAAMALVTSLGEFRGQPVPDMIGPGRVLFLRAIQHGMWRDEMLDRMAARDLDLESIDGEELLLTATSAWAYPHTPRAEPEVLECVDWMPVVAFLTKEGPGTEVAADRLAAMALTKYRGYDRPGPGSDEFIKLEREFASLMPIWASAWVTRDGLLTDLGQWLLPRAFCRSWGVDFDEGQ